jgi:hypothetical protein
MSQFESIADLYGIRAISRNPNANVTRPLLNREISHRIKGSGTNLELSLLEHFV